MKTLGLIGGISWESTATYYRRLNQIARDRLGGQHSAKLVMVSVDFAPIAAMQAAGEWEGATAAMVDAARTLAKAGADGVLICANTMHKMADAVEQAAGVPLIHIADATAAAIVADDRRKPLLLATRFTMEPGFYSDRLSQSGVNAIVPNPAERERLHAIIYEELVLGRMEPASKAQVLAMIARAVLEDGADSVIFGCTKIGLLIEPRESPLPVFDTAEIHCLAAMDFALR
jgi:aspartate racemase